MAEEERKNLTEYRKLVQQMFEEGSSEIISNRDTDHARILIETMIARATRSLDFFCRDLNLKVYGQQEIASKMVAAGLRGVKIRVLTQLPPVSDLASLLLPWFPEKEQVEFRVAGQGTPAADADYNFVVMDGIAFRFETDREKHEASASANNPNLARKINSKFEEFWNSITACHEVKAEAMAV